LSLSKKKNIYKISQNLNKFRERNSSRYKRYSKDFQDHDKKNYAFDIDSFWGWESDKDNKEFDRVYLSKSKSRGSERSNSKPKHRKTKTMILKGTKNLIGGSYSIVNNKNKRTTRNVIIENEKGNKQSKGTGKSNNKKRIKKRSKFSWITISQWSEKDITPAKDSQFGRALSYMLNVNMPNNEFDKMNEPPSVNKDNFETRIYPYDKYLKSNKKKRLR